MPSGPWIDMDMAEQQQQLQHSSAPPPGEGGGSFLLPVRSSSAAAAAFLQSQLDAAQSPAKGFASSRLSAYRPLGAPDVKRDGSFLPKIGKLYHSQLSQNRGDLEEMQTDLVLPMRLRGCYWNGERWCGTPFIPRLASTRNGYAFLHDKIKASNKHLIACRNGKYFLKSSNWTEAKFNSKDRRLGCIQVAVPKLNLKSVNQDFEFSQQLSSNAGLVFAYRCEAKRIASARSACISPGFRSGLLKKGSTTDRPSCGVIPPSAVTDASLRQLSNILDKETRFKAVQNSLNERSKQIGKAIDSTRPFSYTRQFMSLKHLTPTQQSWDNRPTDSPRRMEAFRKGLAFHQWYNELIAMMFLGNRSPSKPELEILSYIAKILESGLQFGPKDYVKLLKHLEMIGADLNNYATSQAIMHIRSALEIPDELLLDGYLRTCRTIPAFLASIDVPNNFCRLSTSPRTRGSTS